MNAGQKRSSGGYGLRRKVTKKRLDEDFEYYFSKIGNPWETKNLKDENDSNDGAKVHARLLVVTDVMKSGSKEELKRVELPEKRPRGRPRKLQAALHDREPDISDTNLKFVDLKEKRIRKPKVIFIEKTETSKAVGDICGKVEEVVAVAHEEVVQDEPSVEKHLKLEPVLGDEITGLQEEEVSSLPEGEKENLPEDGVTFDSDSEETVIVQMDIGVQEGESGEIESELYEVRGDLDQEYEPKLKQKYRRNRLSDDVLRKLSQLSPEDKIECYECHKLLKPSSFRQHLRTHTGEKPFGCEVCEARFTRKGDVERHVRIVHNKQKPFKCSRCHRAFGDKKNLRWHILNHNKKLFYVCEVCGFKFGKREYWENHVRFIHPLPGGLDPSQVGDMDSEERLQALTETLLGEDEMVLVSSEQDGAASLMKTISPNECLLGSDNKLDASPVVPHSVKPRGLKGVSSLVKIARPSDPSHFMVHNQADGIDAVVIQFSDSGVASSTLHSLPKISQESVSNNMVHLVDPSQLLELVQGNETSTEQQSIVIDTQNYEMTVKQEGQITEPYVNIAPEDPKIDVEYIESEPDKVISIMLNDDHETETITKSTNVQTLIEALLDAAKDDKETGQSKNESTSQNEGT